MAKKTTATKPAATPLPWRLQKLQPQEQPKKGAKKAAKKTAKKA